MTSAPAARSAVVMDVSCWHTAVPNTSACDRVYTIGGYVRAAGEGARPAGPPHGVVHRRLEAKGLLPTSRKRILGLALDPTEAAAWESGELVTPAVRGARRWLDDRLGSVARGL